MLQFHGDSDRAAVHFSFSLRVMGHGKGSPCWTRKKVTGNHDHFDTSLIVHQIRNLFFFFGPANQSLWPTVVGSPPAIVACGRWHASCFEWRTTETFRPRRRSVKPTQPGRQKGVRWPAEEARWRRRHVPWRHPTYCIWWWHAPRRKIGREHRWHGHISVGTA